MAEGVFTADQGTVSAPLMRVSGSVITRKVDFTLGQPAVTHYQVLERFRDHTLLSLKLETGRTHQIRVHKMCIRDSRRANPAPRPPRKNAGPR